MRTVFLSYRRGDSEGQARALNSELVKLVGKDSVFMDVDGIALGQDFRHIQHERLESCAKLAMEVAGKTKLEGATSTLALRKSPTSVLIHNFSEVPAEYFTVKIDRCVDKEKVKRDLKAGVEVPGAELVDNRFYLVRR